MSKKRIDVTYTCPKCMNKVIFNRVQVYALNMQCAFCDCQMELLHHTIINGEEKSEPRS